MRPTIVVDYIVPTSWSTIVVAYVASLEDDDDWLLRCTHHQSHPLYPCSPTSPCSCFASARTSYAVEA